MAGPILPERRPSRRLVLALVGSILLHLVVLFGQQIDLRWRPSDLERLDVRLVRPAPASTPGQAPLVEKPKPPRSKPKPKPTPQTAKAESAEPPKLEIPEPQPEPEQTAEAQPEPETPPAVEPPKQVGQQWPRQGMIRYYLFGGENRNPATASSAEMYWTIEPDGAYQMALESRDATPFPSMPSFKITLSYASAGHMVEGQFKPDRYEEKISVFQNIAVNFDWNKQVVDFSGHSLPLHPGTLDFLTVMMQAGDPGFLDRGTVSVATSRGLRQYQFEAGGEEELALPFGKTWKVRQMIGHSDKNDVRVWVATEQFNLPVQIKFVVNRVNYYLIAKDVLVSREAVSDPATPTVAVPGPNERQK